MICCLCQVAAGLSCRLLRECSEACCGHQSVSFDGRQDRCCILSLDFKREFSPLIWAMDSCEQEMHVLCLARQAEARGGPVHRFVSSMHHSRSVN